MPHAIRCGDRRAGADFIEGAVHVICADEVLLRAFAQSYLPFVSFIRAATTCDDDPSSQCTPAWQAGAPHGFCTKPIGARRSETYCEGIIAVISSFLWP